MTYIEATSKRMLTFVLQLEPGGAQVELDAEHIQRVEDTHAK